MAEQGRHGRDRLDAVEGRSGAAPSNAGLRAIAKPPLPRRTKTPLPISTMGAGMLAREVTVAAPDVVFVKGLVEASDGLAAVFAERGGDLTLVAPFDRAAELDEFIDDLAADLGANIKPRREKP
jgi:hypothetical protein